MGAYNIKKVFLIFSLVLLIISLAGVCAVEDNTTSIGADDSSSNDIIDDSSTNDYQDDGGSTGDEEFDLDLTYDDEDDLNDDMSVNKTDEYSVSVKLSKHSTGIPLVILIVFVFILPVLRHD